VNARIARTNAAARTVHQRIAIAGMLTVSVSSNYKKLSRSLDQVGRKQLARALRTPTFRQRKIRPKKGRGSYSRAKIDDKPVIVLFLYKNVHYSHVSISERILLSAIDGSQL
jgi:stalled ribosome alternative rescue factor ArfA